jgi:cell division protein FtsB
MEDVMRTPSALQRENARLRRSVESLKATVADLQSAFKEMAHRQAVQDDEARYRALVAKLRPQPTVH